MSEEFISHLGQRDSFADPADSAHDCSSRCLDSVVSVGKTSDQTKDIGYLDRRIMRRLFVAAINSGCGSGPAGFHAVSFLLLVPNVVSS